MCDFEAWHDVHRAGTVIPKRASTEVSTQPPDARRRHVNRHSMPIYMMVMLKDESASFLYGLGGPIWKLARLVVPRAQVKK